MEIDGQTLGTYSIHLKNGKKSYKHKSENSSFPRYKLLIYDEVL